MAHNLVSEAKTRAIDTLSQTLIDNEMRDRLKEVKQALGTLEEDVRNVYVPEIDGQYGLGKSFDKWQLVPHLEGTGNPDKGKLPTLLSSVIESAANLITNDADCGYMVEGKYPAPPLEQLTETLQAVQKSLDEGQKVYDEHRHAEWMAPLKHYGEWADKAKAAAAVCEQALAGDAGRQYGELHTLTASRQSLKPVGRFTEREESLSGGKKPVKPIGLFGLFSRRTTPVRNEGYPR